MRISIPDNYMAALGKNTELSGRGIEESLWRKEHLSYRPKDV